MIVVEPVTYSVVDVVSVIEEIKVVMVILVIEKDSVAVTLSGTRVLVDVMISVLVTVEVAAGTVVVL